jgi:hypothetical protein
MKTIETLENKYLDKYFHFFKYIEDEMLNGFKSMYDIESDWRKHWKTNKSDFSTGAERIVYGLLNGKAFGTPNSTPVSADLLFELDDAFIHIDVKTYGETNRGDFTSSHTIDSNQTSYRCEILQENGTPFPPRRIHKANLPNIYTKKNKETKVCLTYFLSILTKNNGRDLMAVILTCLPNGKLYEHYLSRPISAGKNHEKKRNPKTKKDEHVINIDKGGNPYQFGKGKFNFKEVNTFELLDSKPSRVKVIYFDNALCSPHKSLDFIRKIHKKQ